MKFLKINVRKKAVRWIARGLAATGSVTPLAGWGLQPLNILFIVSEDNGPEIGCYGSPVSTPHFDALAGKGTRFDKAYVPQAGCSQSRASFLTGLYPHQNGQIGLATWKYAMYRPNTPNVVSTLKKAGYRTGIIGKLHVNPSSAFPFDFKAVPESNFSRKNMARYTQATRDFIGKNDTPFYLQVNHPDAHRPFIRQVDGLPKRPLSGSEVDALPYMGLNHPELRQQTADYYNCMMRLDHYVGQLLDILEASGKSDQTLVVYIGDHGADIFRGKRTCYEGGVRIPMIIRWPGAPAQQVRNDLVSTLDLFPTFCAAAGIAAPIGLPGRSLKPLLSGPVSDWRKTMVTEYHVHSNHNPWPQRAIRNHQFKLIHNPLAGQENPGYAFTFHKFLKTEEHIVLGEASERIQQAYARMKQPPEFELYDLETDPFEFNNLAGNPAFRSQQETLLRQLRAWQKKTRDALADPAQARKLFQQITDAGMKRSLLPYKAFMAP